MLAGLNHKMSNRGTANALLSLGDGTFAPGGRPGAVGYLVGGEGAGLAQMFHMMNEARIVIGISAAALGYTGYLQSLAYARTAAEGKTGDFYDGKRDAARYFFSYELPRTAAQFDLLASLDRSMLELSESWF